MNCTTQLLLQKLEEVTPSPNPKLPPGKKGVASHHSWICGYTATGSAGSNAIIRDGYITVRAAQDGLHNRHRSEHGTPDLPQSNG
ncbi:MAG: hypothetical protein H6558_22895 [Lewinellaceae bacterium]|nr:hypothetical protein [Lewinellaceae bacterium]